MARLIHGLAGIALLAIAFCTAPVLTEAQLPSDVTRYLWHAEWIVSPTAPARDEAVLHFRKIFELSAKPQRFHIKVSADNRFILYVNQQRVGSGPARADLEHWRYETFDIAPFLKPGKNVVAAVVWNFGARTGQAQISDRTAFILQGAGETEKILDTDKSWEVAQEKAVQSQPKPESLQYFYFVAEPALRFDGTAMDWSWNAEDGSTGKWEKAVALGHGSERGSTLQENNWQLVPDPLPPLEYRIVPAGKVVRSSGASGAEIFPDKGVSIPANSTATILLDNGFLTTSYPELTVSGGSGSKVRLTYTEALVDEKGAKGNRNEIEGKHIFGVYDEFLPDGAQNRVFQPLVWRTWRYLQLDVTTGAQPVTLESLRNWFSAFPFEERAKFQSEDPQLQSIWEIGWRTARLDAHDTYMDTPYWEQMQYIGDTRIQALISYAVAGDDRLPRQAIQAFNDSRIPEGITHSRYPTSMFQAIPPFSLLWVGMVHDFWMYRGDTVFVQSQLAGTRATLDWYLTYQRDDGLLKKTPWWSFADWGSDFEFGDPPQDVDGGSSVLTLQFVEALRNQAELESALGDTTRATLYRDAAAKAVAGVKKLCWHPGYGLLADTPAQKHFSQHANILGVWLDVIPIAQQKEVLTKILSASDTGFRTNREIPPMTKATYYFRFYLARAVEHAGMGEDYLRLLGPWKEMAGLGLTTWAEQPEPTRSDSHAWSAHPNYDLLAIVAGIRPAEPGFGKVIVAPHLGNLKHLIASQPIPAGRVDVEYTQQTDGWIVKVVLPPGVSGELRWKDKTYPLHESLQSLQLP